MTSKITHQNHKLLPSLIMVAWIRPMKRKESNSWTAWSLLGEHQVRKLRMNGNSLNLTPIHFFKSAHRSRRNRILRSSCRLKNLLRISLKSRSRSSLKGKAINSPDNKAVNRLCWLMSLYSRLLKLSQLPRQKRLQHRNMWHRPI